MFQADVTCDEMLLSPTEYEKVRQLVYSKSGINLGPAKQQLVRARLSKRVRDCGFSTLLDYIKYVERDQSGQELQILLDSISTNTTHLFREKVHFDFIAQQIKQWADDRDWRRSHSTLRIWSAACSSGEEPYTIAMTVHHVLSNLGLSAKILATDISTRVLAMAKRGIYERAQLKEVPVDFRSRYFRAARNNGEWCYEIAPEIREMITFSQFNLMTPRFPFKNGFDIVFCRNVMIYFDAPTREGLIGRITQHLLPGGYLIVGHSESLNNIKQPLSYIQPTIYQKRENPPSSLMVRKIASA